MIRYTASFLGAMLLLTLFLQVGCVTRSAPKVNYFSLLRMDQLGEKRRPAAQPEMRLGIGPVTIPDYLQRSQIVTRKHGNQFEFDEYNRWAGVLEHDLAAAIGDNLGILLGVNAVGYYPWQRNFEPTYRITVSVERLDGDLAGEAVLEARWSVTTADNKELPAENRSRQHRPVKEGGYAALIIAESELVADLSRDIAGHIERAPKGW